jgi:glucans biosynthesis protein
MVKRRTVLASAAASLGLSALGVPTFAHAARSLKMGRATPFAHAQLIERARTLASQPYRPPAGPPRDILEKIDYAAHGKLKFKTEYALFADGAGQFPVTFFHLGRFFQTPVRMHLVEPAGAAQSTREILYDEAYFDMPADSPARDLPRGSGFAGFRFQESRTGSLDWRTNDWVAFLGASYFRAVGELLQYGLSARGIAVDVAVADKPEEFPAFTHVYFETPQAGSDTVVVHALLDGPSLSGAYRFTMRRAKKIVTDVEATLFVRRDIARLGIAPATSMYWYSETAKGTAVDWRPEVHDSDGLAIWTGAGEHIWRPLNNPPRTTASSFVDRAPKGFGLLQRDRAFENYLDGVHYEKRPSLWVEPLEAWGKGAVQLIEIPTDDEIHDNIVAMWVPDEPARAGAQLQVKYRLHWNADEPYPSPLARCVATRLGNGGQPGEPRPHGVRKFMVEFLGGPLVDLPYGVKPEAVLSASRGTFSYVFTEAVPNGVPGHWRAQFDLTAEGDAPIDMRLFLKSGERTLSETWLFQYHPFASVLNLWSKQ